MLGEYGGSAHAVYAEFIWMSSEVSDSGLFGGDDGLGGYMPLAVAANDNGATQLSWVHGNHMGVPAVYTDASGGEIAMPAGYSAPGFPGQSRTFADLYYNRYRDYDPTTGRYIQADPIGLAGGPSPYSYAMNNPLRYTDPTGELVPLVVIGGIVVRGLVGAAIETGIQAGMLWYQDCDLFDLDNYNKSNIVIAGGIGAIVPGPGGPAWKHFKEWRRLSGIEKSINRPTIEAAKRAFRKDAAFQAARGAAGAAIKRGYDAYENNQ